MNEQERLQLYERVQLTKLFKEAQNLLQAKTSLMELILLLKDRAERLEQRLEELDSRLRNTLNVRTINDNVTSYEDLQSEID